MAKHALNAPFSKDEEVQGSTIGGKSHDYNILGLGKGYPSTLLGER